MGKPPARIQPLTQNQPIVDAQGRPNDYFIRWAQQRQDDIVDAVPDDREIIAGVGLDGGGALSDNITIDLADTAVTPGPYTNVNVTVDQQGRITAIADGNPGIPEAPMDGQFYCRQNGAWVAFVP